MISFNLARTADAQRTTWSPFRWKNVSAIVRASLPWFVENHDAGDFDHMVFQKSEIVFHGFDPSVSIYEIFDAGQTD